MHDITPVTLLRHICEHFQPHTTLFLVMMRLNLKYVLTSLILCAACITLMLWSRCGDLVRTFPKRFYGKKQAPFLISAQLIVNFASSESISSHRGGRD